MMCHREEGVARRPWRPWFGLTVVALALVVAPAWAQTSPEDAGQATGATASPQIICQPMAMPAGGVRPHAAPAGGVRPHAIPPGDSDCMPDVPFPPSPLRSAQFVSQTVSPVMRAGSSQTVTIKMKNTGDHPWTKLGGYSLGSRYPTNNTTWGRSRVKLVSDVAPGKTATFRFSIRAPTTRGTYSFQWMMLQEGVVWFEHATPRVAIHVLAGSIDTDPHPCNIAVGESQCTVMVHWTSNSDAAKVLVSNLSGGSPVLFASGQSGNKYASWIPVEGRRFTLKSNGIVLASVDVHGTLPPVIAWSEVPDDGQYLLSSDTIPLRVSASDPDGSIAKVEFTLDGSIKATDSASPYLTSFSHLSAGTHTLSAVAIDKQGRSRAARIVTIHVRDSIIMGDIDGVSSEGLVTGWACSRYLPQSVKVDVYAGGPAGTGTKLGRYLANKSSDSSIDTTCGASGGHYRYAIQLTDAQRQKHAGQKIYMHGLSPVGGGNYKLGHSGSFTIPPVPPPVVASSTTIAYDPLGRVIAVYDNAHHLKASYQYDKNGNVTKVTDALGQATSMTYDALDRVIAVTDAGGHVTTYQYDRGGRVKAVTDPRRNTTSYTYDGFGQLWERSSPDTGTTTYSYADDGQLQGMTRADGTLLTYTYDTLGRPTSVTTGTQTRSMTYDTCTNGIGRLCSAGDADSTTAYTYDPQGDITQRHFTVGSTSYALGYSYDGMGRLATLTYPDGNQASYHYQYGRLSGIKAVVNGATKTVASALTYSAGNRLLTSWTAGNGLVNSYTYDGNGRLTGIAVPGVQDLGFTYDHAGRITGITNGVLPSLSQTFTYDAMSRLNEVASPSGNESYTYDINGNRTGQTVDGTTTPLVIQTQSNRLASVGGQAIGYDANGNTTTVGGVVKYHYDSFNRLHSAGGMTYVINPEGQRLRKSGTLGTTDFAPDQSGALLAEHPDSGWVDYVYLGGRLVGRIADNQVYAVATDQVGRPEVVTNTAKTIVWQAQNKAFDRSVSTENVVLNLGFPGQYYDAETGLWYNGFRDYDPALGRYIESDSMGLSAGTNTYAYVGDNPIMNDDPLGLCPSKKCGSPPKLPPGVSVKANIRQMERLRAREGSSGDPFYTGLFSKFYSLVRYGGPWDYKTQDSYRGEYDAGGNFNYGAVGAAAGISTPLLRAAAGAAQIWHGSSRLKWVFNGSLGDEPADVTQILAGVAYYQCLSSGSQ